MNNALLQKQIARIRATGATYGEAMARAAVVQVLGDNHAANMQAFEKRTILPQGRLKIGSYRRK